MTRLLGFGTKGQGTGAAGLIGEGGGGGGGRQRIKEVKKIGKMRVMGETGPLRKLTGKTHNVFVCVGG